MHKTCAVIPTYNEALHISAVIREAKKHVDMVIVSDDHSTDATREIAKLEGAEVILNTGPQGAGRNTWLGIAAAWMIGAEIVVTLDGDGQHDASEIPKLIEPILRGKDIVIGARNG